uniref:Uncharacterized protein n=1 Tax=Knipowitschia caucasica TaxID=637954 RepID=A0AAV2KXE3_KNICA
MYAEILTWILLPYTMRPCFWNKNSVDKEVLIRHAPLLWQGKPALSPKRWESQQVWREAYAVCRRTIAPPPGDGFLGYVRPAGRRPVRVPPKSEILVWGRTTSGPCGADYAAVLEAMPEAEAWGIARTLSVVRGGRVPVRVCNPQLYPVYIGRYQKLGRLYHVEEADVQGARDLSLTMGPDGVVEVGLVDTPDSKEEHTEEGVNKLVDCPHLTHQQQLELQALLQKWRKVFATNEEDFGRTDLVQHRIHTADAPPTKERQRLPPKNVYYYRCPDHRRNYVMSFAFCFDREDDVYQFAYCYPYTYSRLQHYLGSLERRNLPYLKREQLGLSVLQRKHFEVSLRCGKGKAVTLLVTSDTTRPPSVEQMGRVETADLRGHTGALAS